MKKLLVLALFALLAARPFGALAQTDAPDAAQASPGADPRIVEIPHVTAAVGGSKCYRQDEAEAEQAVRIDTELMVIGLNCQGMRSIPGSNSLYTNYRLFNQRHGKLLAEYEARLVGYFLRTGTRDANGALNQLHTEFANKISLEAAHMRPDLFCAQYAPRIGRVSGMTDADIQRWAGTFYPAHPTTRPICGH